jgi:NTE family protein
MLWGSMMEEAGRIPIPVVLIIASLLTGCLSAPAVNDPLAAADPAHGYRPNIPEQHRSAGSVLVLLAFSGGGTRAASFAYGVLEELRDTKVVVQGERKRLLDEVDTISGVSGGSFPAAYYGLYGDQIFEEFESNFLKRNVQGALIGQLFRPWNLLRLFTPATSRSELASQYYDKHIFHNATFADLKEAKGPRIYINATDLSYGNRFTFSQQQFDIICSDIDVFKISRAVAASSAVPGMLSPISLRNYAGDCGFEPPAWIEAAMNSRSTDPRRYRAASAYLDYDGAKRRPYVHLVDGGISDNLGLRASLDIAAAAGGYEAMRKMMGVGRLDHVVIIVVNAETDPNPNIDLTNKAPGLMLLMNSVSGAQIRRYNFETMLLAQDAIREVASQMSRPGNPVQGHFVEVSFDLTTDPERRRYLKTLPTSFVLKDEEVDDLREAGRQLLRDSPAFKKLVEQLQ